MVFFFISIILYIASQLKYFVENSNTIFMEYKYIFKKKKNMRPKLASCQQVDIFIMFINLVYYNFILFQTLYPTNYKFINNYSL